MRSMEVILARPFRAQPPRTGAGAGRGRRTPRWCTSTTRVRGSQSRGRSPALCQSMSRNCAAPSTFGHTDGSSVARRPPDSTSTPSVPARRLRATSRHDRARMGVRRDSTDTLIAITSKSAMVTAGRRGSANAALHALRADARDERLGGLEGADAAEERLAPLEGDEGGRGLVEDEVAGGLRDHGRAVAGRSAYPIESAAIVSSARRCSSSSGSR